MWLEYAKTVILHSTQQTVFFNTITVILLILNVCRLEKQATFEHLALSEIKKWSSTVYQAFKNIMSVVLLSPFLTSEFIQQAAVVSLMLFLIILKISKISR